MKLEWEEHEPLSRLIHSVGRQYRCFKTRQGNRDVYRLEKLVSDLWYYQCGEPQESFVDIQRLAQEDNDRAISNAGCSGLQGSGDEGKDSRPAPIVNGDV